MSDSLAIAALTYMEELNKEQKEMLTKIGALTVLDKEHNKRKLLIKAVLESLAIRNSVSNNLSSRNNRLHPDAA